MTAPTPATSKPLHAFRCDICQGVEYDAETGPHDCPDCDLRMREIPLEEAAGVRRD